MKSMGSKDATKPARKAPVRPSYSEAFEAAWIAWRDAAGGGDKKPAFAVWEALSAEDRVLAAKAIPLFGADLARRKAARADTIPLHFERYLRNRRFETLLEASADTSRQVGPNGKAWGWWKGREAGLRGLGLERWRAALDKAKPNGAWPWWLLGPAPGAEDCLIPPALLDEMGLVAKYRGQLSAVTVEEGRLC